MRRRLTLAVDSGNVEAKPLKAAALSELGERQTSAIALNLVLVGVGETGGAAMLLIPRLARRGATGLSAITLGAVATRLRYGEPARAVVPLVLIALLTEVAWGRRPRS